MLMLGPYDAGSIRGYTWHSYAHNSFEKAVFQMPRIFFAHAKSSQFMIFLPFMINPVFHSTI